MNNRKPIVCVIGEKKQPFFIVELRLYNLIHFISMYGDYD